MPPGTKFPIARVREGLGKGWSSWAFRGSWGLREVAVYQSVVDIQFGPYQHPGCLGKHGALPQALACERQSPGESWGLPVKPRLPGAPGHTSGTLTELC